MQVALQLALDAADRLVEAVGGHGGPLPAGDAARVLLPRMRVPAAVARAVVDGVVRDDDRLAWLAPDRVGLVAWSRGSVAIEDAVFCVVDLETTGLSPTRDRIVEIGAVRVEALELAGTFERLVDPGVPLPDAVRRLTGLADRDLRGRERPPAAVRAFTAFAGDAVLVAHNARFDVGFLDAALARAEGRRLACAVLDTALLARRLLRGRLRRFSLGRLADHLGTTVEPCHRALPDARATAEVLLALLGRAQERGARTVDDVLALGAPQPTRALARRHLADGAPEAPGTYRMEDAGGNVLYVGSAGDLRRRVRSYFAGPPARERPVDRALPAVQRISYATAGSELEARLDEAAQLAALRPTANRRDARPERAAFAVLDGAPPRLRVAARPAAAGPERVVVGPLAPRRRVVLAVEALRLAYGLRGCTAAGPSEGACVEGRLGRCLAPCRGGEAAVAYAEAARLLGDVLGGGGSAPVARLRERRASLVRDRRFEDAARLRDGEDALRRLAVDVARLRRARACHGILLAPHVDARMVAAFAVAHGLVAARRALPRLGDAGLERAALVADLAAAIAAGPGSSGPLAVPAERHAELRVIDAALRRPSAGTVALALPPAPTADDLARAESTLADLRERVPARA